MKLIYTVIIIGALIALISGILLSYNMKQMGNCTNAKNRFKHQSLIVACGFGLSFGFTLLGFLVPFAILNLILNIFHASVLIKKVILGIYILFVIICFFISLKELKK